MATYLFVHSTVHDVARFDQYREASAASVAQYGGELLVAGQVSDVLEGQHEQKRAVVFRFPDRAAVLGWYNSPEYRQVMGLRAGTGYFNFIVVEGF